VSGGSPEISNRKVHRKVFFEIFNRQGYAGRFIYSQRHMRFSEADVPDLFGKRPYRTEEPHVPEYRYRLDRDGIHIALLYEGASLPE